MKRKALLVGINDYAPKGGGGPDLGGCLNDVRDVAHTLNALQIVPAGPQSMKILTNSRATRKAIMDGLGWLLAGAAKGDVLVFYYSGHGSYVADLPPDKDELDGKDETICPHDFESAGMIKDDDFKKLFAALKNKAVNLEVIFDSCHSGSATRGATGVAPRFVEPPLDYGYFVESQPRIPVRRFFGAAPGERPAGKAGAVVVPGLSHVFWAGCRDNETSGEADVGGSVRGFFTYHFCKVLRRAGAGITRARLDSLVCADMAAAGISQHPQLEGTKSSINQRVFT
jgi:hypothetical protein